MENKLEFKVYRHNLIIEKGLLIKRHLITLKYGKHIVGWTNFHKYFTVGKKKKAIKVETNAGNRPYDITKFLNYVFFGPYNINRLDDITVEMAKNYLNAYGMCDLPDDDDFVHRQETTVEIVVTHITDFLLELIKKANVNFTADDLVVEYEYFDDRTRKYKKGTKPIFTVYCVSSEYDKYKDIPDKAFNIIMENIKTNHVEILMLATNCAFAGLRGGESCNVRRKDGSPLGPGIEFDTIDEEIYDIRIDLTQEYNLRSDFVSVGSIKKHRKQKVYPSFLEAWMNNYEYYIKHCPNKKYESNFGALSNNQKGMAMTYHSFYQEFKKAVEECIPIFLNSDDPQLVLYGRKLQDGASISPHILRHWFTVQLVLEGCTEAEIMDWRGDKSPKSAKTYLKNKGDIMKEYKKVNSNIFDILYEEASKRHKK